MNFKIPLYNKKNLQSGQGLLIVILVMVIALTVGLSVAVRTTSNLRTSSDGENSERAFSAAEAGIELSSTSNLPNSSSLPNNTTYATTVTILSGNSLNLNNGTIVLKDEPVDIWLATYPTYSSPWTGTLDINWGSATDTCDPIESNNTQSALEVVVISGSLTTPKTTTYLLDPCSSRASSSNAEQISTAGDNINGTTYFRKKSIPITSGLIVRVIPLYSSTVIGVQKAAGDPDLPSQGTIITATGTSNETKRKILSYKGFPKLPVELFPFVLFSPK
ncbi:MAG TPA: pilus assembly PilX N-terminal domain-containing protein [Candidatus Limnocylindrales bacterium]|nr:pilus assembly PilX N-terminal domain-containing protein [Candidatus Limnocylindrales bacterium]